MQKFYHIYINGSHLKSFYEIESEFQGTNTSEIKSNQIKSNEWLEYKWILAAVLFSNVPCLLQVSQWENELIEIYLDVFR